MKNSFLGAMAMGLALLAATGCEPKVKNPGTLSVELEHVWGMNETPFALNTALTHPMTSEELTFTMLKYYISNVSLTREDGTVWNAPESYYLVDLSQPLSTQLSLTEVPAGHYTGLSFLLGVDSVRNVSGAQTGALDVANGMFWSWNSGYIFAKAEGTSPNAASGTFQYHLGGFSGTKKAMQTVSFSFDTHAVVEEGASPTVHLSVNPARLWHMLPGVATESTIHMPGNAAKDRMAAFAGGFAFEHLHN
jgi:hypothetical protein